MMFVLSKHRARSARLLAIRTTAASHLLSHSTLPDRCRAATHWLGFSWLCCTRILGDGIWRKSMGDGRTRWWVERSSAEISDSLLHMQRVRRCGCSIENVETSTLWEMALNLNSG
jgi:hypothetical protein